MIQRIFLQFAMLEEALPTISTLGLQETQDYQTQALPFQYFSGNQSGVDVLLTTQGSDPRFQAANVGTQAATLCAHHSMQQFQPDLVINAGTAGFLSNDGSTTQIGDVLLSKKHFIFHDRQIPLPNYQDYGLGKYPSVDTQTLATMLKLQTGIVSTGNALIKKADDINIMQTNDASIKDMEAAAIAWVCMLHQTPVFAIKTITNILTNPQSSEAQFKNNFTLCVNNLSIEIKKIIEIIAQKKWSC